MIQWVEKWVMQTSMKLLSTSFQRTRPSSLSPGSRAATFGKQWRLDHLNMTCSSRMTTEHKVSPNGTTSGYRTRARIRPIDSICVISWSPTPPTPKVWDLWPTPWEMQPRAAHLGGREKARTLLTTRRIGRRERTRTRIHLLSEEVESSVITKF